MLLGLNGQILNSKPQTLHELLTEDVGNVIYANISFIITAKRAGIINALAMAAKNKKTAETDHEGAAVPKV